MSDVRAKAEARRAKILARDTSKSVKSAGDEDDGPALLPSSEKVERPLAARKQRIEASKLETTSPLAVAEGSREDLPDDAPSEEAVHEEELLRKERAGVKAAEKAAKTVQEIEEEVKRRTAEFDAQVLRDGIKKESAVKDKAKKAAVKAKTPPASSGVAVKVLRAALIVSLGILTGYRSVSSDRTVRELLVAKYAPASYLATKEVCSSETRVKKSIDDSEGLEGDEFVAYQTMTNEAVKMDTGRVIRGLENERTWQRWFAKKLRRQMETSLSAVSLTGWVLFFGQPLFAALFGAVSAPKKNYLTMAWGLVNGGAAGLVDPAVNYMGEVAMHTFAALCTSVAVNEYYKHKDADAGHCSAQETAVSSAKDEF